MDNETWQKIKSLARIGLALPKFDTDDVMVTSLASIEKHTSHKSWTMKLGRKIKSLARIGLARPKFDTDDVMVTSQASIEKHTSHKSWTMKLGRKLKALLELD